MVKQNCIECGIKTNIYSKMQEYICKNCKILDKYKLITKTASKNDYFLKDDDLNDIKSYEAHCAYGPTTYYKKQEVIIKSCEKYNTALDDLGTFLDNMREEKQAKRNERHAKREEKLLVKLNKRR
jgi:hypothetical protein